jgi:hypothetical protein
MAADDYAILVGISRYADPAFPALTGPPRDVALVKEWLMSANGGNVPADRIRTILSPESFPPDLDALQAPPLASQFHLEFVKMERERMALKGERTKSGRLYLFFSGHGFCARDIDRDAEAALYAANAAKDFFEHIYGTYFARRAKAKALFPEVVLIMDCCRDAEVNRAPIQPTLANTPDDGLTGNVKVLAIYAVPRGGKAHERAIPERGGVTHGLLTHALFKTLAEARPTGEGMVTATRLRDHLLQAWEAVCGEDAAPRPDFHLPTDEMFFTAQNSGVGVEFSFNGGHAPGTVLVLRNGRLKKVAEISATGDDNDDVIAENGPILKWQRDGKKFLMRVLPDFYAYELSDASKKDKFKAEGVDIHVSL